MTLESAVMQSCVASVTKYETIETHAGYRHSEVFHQPI